MNINNLSSKMPKLNLDKMPKIEMDTQFFVIIVSVLFLLAAIIYIYINHIEPSFKKKYVANKEFVEGDKQKKPVANVILFSTNWCPHCTKLKEDQIYVKFANENQNKVINGYKLNIQEVDCSDDKKENIKTLLSEYNVDGFPTIKLIKEGDPPSKAIDYNAKPTVDNLNQFVNTVL